MEDAQVRGESEFKTATVSDGGECADGWDGEGGEPVEGVAEEGEEGSCSVGRLVDGRMGD